MCYTCNLITPVASYHVLSSACTYILVGYTVYVSSSPDGLIVAVGTLFYTFHAEVTLLQFLTQVFLSLLLTIIEGIKLC